MRMFLTGIGLPIVTKTGNYTLTATFTPSNPSNYTSLTATVNITVNPANPQISWPSTS